MQITALYTIILANTRNPAPAGGFIELSPHTPLFIRKGAALNTIQIAELLIQKGLV